MNHFPASIVFSAAISAVLLSACSSDGNVGFGAGVNGLRVNPAPGTPDPTPAPAATPVSATSAAAGVSPATLSLSRSGLSVTAPSLSADAASDGSASIGNDALLSTGNLVQPVAGVLKSALDQSPLSSGALANLNLNSDGQPVQPGVLSNALAPVTDIAASLSGSANPASNANVVGNVLNDTSAVANGTVSAATAIVGNTPLVGSLTSPAAPTQGNLLSIGATPDNGVAASLGNNQLLPLKLK